MLTIIPTPKQKGMLSSRKTRQPSGRSNYTEALVAPIGEPDSYPSTTARSTSTNCNLTTINYKDKEPPPNPLFSPHSSSITSFNSARTNGSTLTQNTVVRQEKHKNRRDLLLSRRSVGLATPISLTASPQKIRQVQRFSERNI